MSEVSQQNILATIPDPRPLSLNIESLARGIDNYHIDVNLSKKFCADVVKTVDLLVSQLAIPNPKTWDNSKQLDELRDKYADMLTVLIHRVKTDLKPNEISFLQMAAAKFIIRTVRTRLQDDLGKLATHTSALRNKGSTESLASDKKLFWLRKNSEYILFTVNRTIFNHLHRGEIKQLATIRSQHMPAEYLEFSELLFNPLLFATDLSALQLLISEYCLWDLNSHPEGFLQLNAAVEKLYSQTLKELPEFPLKSITQGDSELAEITDELGGFVACQPFLGQVKDSKDLLGEQLSWLEDPAVVQRIFNTDRHKDALPAIRKANGFAAWWSRRGEIKRLERFLKQFVKILRKQKILPQILAAYQLRSAWSPMLAKTMEIKTACLFVSGALGNKKLLESLGPGQNPTSEQQKFLEELRTRVQEELESVTTDVASRILVDLCRYRLHLKYLRLSHRIFNRISILSRQTDIQLSSEAGTLYHMPTSSEIQDDEERICHHAVLKADVRGSTTVTNELQNKGLNPASYFSLRFFDPINTFLETFGARKVFIEGDAIILSFLEYEHTPQNWVSVARACGMAKEMITIVAQSNRHSTQMALPVLELGIGICYSSDAPRYLYDDGKPIMISGAIGLADRLSSCSWNLRQQMQPGLFNVDVFRYAEGEKGKGEKGQHYVRYNVNGILLDNTAFEKLKTEMTFKRLRLKLNGKECLFYSGQYPDCQGKKHELVIREGLVGLWKNEHMEDDPDSDQKYYEVVVNRKVMSLVLEMKNREQTTS
ncbi:MAG: hypothetical protein WD772_09320 [Pseudohongiellaceae bacterium]